MLQVAQPGGQLLSRGAIVQLAVTFTQITRIAGQRPRALRAVGGVVEEVGSLHA
jgi:hypothetical protein